MDQITCILYKAYRNTVIILLVKFDINLKMYRGSFGKFRVDVFELGPSLIFIVILLYCY